MSRRFSKTAPHVGAALPRRTFGRLVGQFQFASHIPLRGGRETGRHIYLSIKIPSGSDTGIFECAVNVRSDDGTEVLYTERIEDLDTAGPPDFGFDEHLRLAYGSGEDSSDTDFMGLTDADFRTIVNDELYDRIADLSQNCDLVAVYGFTYSEGDGIHDIHMNSATEEGDERDREARVHEDGAIAFYFNLAAGSDRKSFATWVFIKFDDQSVDEE